VRRFGSRGQASEAVDIVEVSPLQEHAMHSDAASVDAYLASLPPERREALAGVREVILKHLPKGYEEGMGHGMIEYRVPLEAYPDTYNGQPLQYAALASQKNYMALYLNTIYVSPESAEAFERAYRATGKRYDVGKSCVRFRRLDDLPLDLVGKTVKSMPLKTFVALARDARTAHKR
jgi:uncharacterized protein YdhG (YjbR/CyaY superfamily)